VSLEEFHYVVVGDEPAGLWLLSALDKALREVGEEPRLAWASLSPEPKPCVLPTLLGPAFGIKPSAPWSADLVTPKGTFSWSSRELSERFPELGPLESTAQGLDALVSPSSVDVGSVRNAIRQHPELIGYAQALWKMLGRSETLNPESLVHFSRFFTSLQWWSPEKDLPSSVERIFLSPFENPIESVQDSARSATVLHWRHYGEVLSRHWIWNSDLRTLSELVSKCEPLRKQLLFDWEPAKLRALFPFPLMVEPEAIPLPVPPLTLIFDTDLIPDPTSEIWPVTLRSTGTLRELTLWASGPALNSLENGADEFRRGMQRLQTLFPFLPQKLANTPFALGLDTCIADSERKRVTELLQASSQEQYRLTNASTETRSSRMTKLLPSLGCHLPYPIGALIKAKSLVADFVGRRKAPPAVKSNESDQNRTESERGAL
jgi:hypothetical protein